MKKKQNKKFAVAAIISLFFISSLILWAGFRKKPPTEKKPLEIPKVNQGATNVSTSQIFFASNGKDSVYKIKKGDKWSVIWNGQEGKEYDFVSNPVFSADGSHFAYSAELNGQAYVVVNNTQEIYAYLRASNLIFSGNGEVIAFVAAQSSSSFVVISSSVLPVGSTSPIPTPNESNPYSQIGIIQTPSGSGTAIIISDNGEHIIFTVIEDDKIYVVADGVESTTGYDSISNLVVNEDGTYSYTATIGDTTVTVVNNTVTSTTTTTESPTNASLSDSTETTNTPTNNTTTTNSPSSGSTINYDGYKYKISTDKDINLENSRIDSGCAGECNF
jgi:hypothetical protein